MASMLTSVTNTAYGAQQLPSRFQLTRCLLSRTPQPTGKKLGKTVFDTHTDSNLMMLISAAGPRLVLAIFKGTTTLLQRLVPDNSASGMEVPSVGLAGTKIMLRLPTTPGYEDVYQLTFPNEQVAATVTNRLNTFITGMANPSTLAGQSHTQTSYQGFQPATQLSTNAQSTPQYANIPLASSYRPPVLASQAAQPESQIPPHRSPSPSPAEEHNDAIQSQGFLETQYTPEEEATQITTNPPRKHPSSDMNVSDTTNPVSNSGHIDKKRKLDSDDTSDAHKSSNEGTDLATQPTKLVSDLIDLSECQNESNDSLGITHPPLDPYEGTPWGPLSRFSSTQSGSSGGSGGVPVAMPNRFITAGLYGMNEFELGEIMDEIVTEVGFQSMCERVACVLDGRRQMESMYQYEMDEGL